MNDCLVTKLKRTVSDSNLEKIGHIKLPVSVNDLNGYIGMSTDLEDGILIEVIDAVITNVKGNAIKISDRVVKLVKNTNEEYPGFFINPGVARCNVDVSNYYGLNDKLSVFYSDSLHKLKYTNVNYVIIVVDKPFNVNDFELKTFYGFAVKDTGSYLSGDFTNIVSKEELTEFIITDSYSSNIYIPFSVLASSKIKTLKIERCPNIKFDANSLTLLGKITSLETIRLQGSNVEGTVEEFVSSKISSGRSSCSGIKIGANMGLNVTFKGSPIDGAEPKILKWTSLSDITIVNE